jgi:hypothetical protein
VRIVSQPTGRGLKVIGAAVIAALVLVALVPSSSTAATAVAGSVSGTIAPGCRLQVDATPADLAPPSAPFLKLPFRARDARNSLYVTQGWLSSPDEVRLTGNDFEHLSADIEFVRSPDNGYGLPVVAAAAGRAYYSYQYLSGEWTDPKTGITHQIGVGAGLVLEIRHSQDQPGNPGWVTQYIHLKDVAPGIPFLGATPSATVPGDWSPTGILQPNDTLWNLGVPVTQGQVIGHQGDTGIGFDWKDTFDPATGTVAPRDRVALPPWDPPQLHFQLYRGRVNNAKQSIVDPFGLYGQVRPGQWTPSVGSDSPYGNVPGNLCVGPRSAFVTNTLGQLLFAAQ